MSHDSGNQARPFNQMRPVIIVNNVSSTMCVREVVRPELSGSEPQSIGLFPREVFVRAFLPVAMLRYRAHRRPDEPNLYPLVEAGGNISGVIMAESIYQCAPGTDTVAPGLPTLNDPAKVGPDAQS